MKNYVSKWLFVVLISISGISLGWAVDHPVDFHHYAKMEYEGFGPVDKTYGYLNIVTNEEGKGMINVMFSNGRETDWVKFNARVKFLDVSGAVIQETNLYRWIGSAGSEGAAERKVTKPLIVPEFDSVVVEFYLTEQQNMIATIPNYPVDITTDQATSL